jgi:hypothetical protein
MFDRMDGIYRMENLMVLAIELQMKICDYAGLISFHPLG